MSLTLRACISDVWLSGQMNDIETTTLAKYGNPAPRITTAYKFVRNNRSVLIAQFSRNPVQTPRLASLVDQPFP